MPITFPSYLKRKEEEPYSLPSYLKRKEDSFPSYLKHLPTSQLSLPIIEYDTITNEPEEVVSNWERLGRRFLEGAIPAGYSADLPRAETGWQTFVEVVGGLGGTGLGFALISSFTGGTGSPAYVANASKLFKVAKGSTNVVKATSSANKLIKVGKAADVASKANKLMRTGKGAEGFAMARELVKTGHTMEAVTALGIQSTGLLGKSGRYVNAFTKLTAVDPRLAKMANTGFTNLLVFNAHGQAYLPPLSTSFADRLQTIQSSSVQSVMFSAASSLRVLGEFPKFMKQPYKATGMHLSEAGMLFGIGAGSDILTEKLGITAPSDMTKTERIIHGLGLVAFHYARLGMNKAGIKSKQRDALRAVGYKDEVEINRIVNAGDKVLDKAIQKASGKEIKKLRAEEKRQVYAERTSKDEVDLLKVYSKEDGQGVVVYHDLATGEVKRVFGSSPRNALGTFKKKFKFIGKTEVETPIEVSPTKEGDIVKSDTVAPSKLKYVPDKEKDPEVYKSWSRLRGSVKGQQKKIGMGDKDFHAVMEEVIPGSKGSTKNMTGEQLLRAKHMITPERQTHSHQVVNRAPLSSFEMIPIKARKIADTYLFRGTLPVSTVLRLTKIKPAVKLAELMENFELHRQFIAGTGVLFNHRLKKEYGLTLKDLNIGQINPEKFGDFVVGEGSAKFAKLSPKQKKAVTEDVRMLYNTLWTRMAMDGVEVKSIVRKNYKHVPIFKVWDSSGKVIPNSSIDPRALTASGKSKLPKTSRNADMSFLRVLEGKQKYLLLKNGKIVKVGKVEGRYEPNYVTLHLTRQARKLLDVDSFTRRAINHMANNDPEIKSLISAGKITKDEALVLAGEKFREYSAWVDQKGVFGQQYSRAADLPPQFAWNTKGDAIELVKFNVKKGDTVKDKYGETHTVNKVVDIYERRLDKIIGAYSQQVAHIASTYRFYGRGGADGTKAQGVINNIKAEHSQSFGRWSEKMVGLQANMTEAGLLAKGFGHTARVTANLGLSSPMSGFKNILLGNVQLYSTFGFSNMLRAWGSFLSKDMGYKAWTDITKAVGGTEIGVHEIITAPYARYSPGLMRPTEIFNRIASVATGDFAAKTALAVLTGHKTPISAFMSKTQARHFLETTLKLKDVDGIIARESAKLKRSRKSIKEEPGFRDYELRKIHQMSHLVTQGGPTIPFVPGWAGSAMGKPLTLFYRIAYRVTENVVQNVIKPALVHGNPLPLMRYAAGSMAAGAGLYSLYYHALGKERNRMKSASANYWMNFIKGEGLSVLSNAFDEYGGAVDAYSPVILRTLQSTYDETSYLFSGTKKPFDAVEDWSRNNIVLFNHATRAWQTHSKSPLAEVRHVRQLRRQFEEEVFGKADKYGDVPAPTKRTPYYRSIRDVFWSDDGRDKAHAYWAAIYYLANELEKENFTPKNARKEALKRIRGVISNGSPLPASWYKKGSRYESRYLTLQKHISKEDIARIQKIMKLYKQKERDFWNDTIKYRKDYYYDVP